MADFVGALAPSLGRQGPSPSHRRLMLVMLRVVSCPVLARAWGLAVYAVAPSRMLMQPRLTCLRRHRVHSRRPSLLVNPRDHPHFVSPVACRLTTGGTFGDDVTAAVLAGGAEILNASSELAPVATVEFVLSKPSDASHFANLDIKYVRDCIHAAVLSMLNRADNRPEGVDVSVVNSEALYGKKPFPARIRVTFSTMIAAKHFTAVFQSLQLEKTVLVKTGKGTTEVPTTAKLVPHANDTNLVFEVTLKGAWSADWVVAEMTRRGIHPPLMIQVDDGHDGLKWQPVADCAWTVGIPLTTSMRIQSADGTELCAPPARRVTFTIAKEDCPSAKDMVPRKVGDSMISQTVRLSGRW